MIVDAILGFFYDLLHSVIGVLPTGAFPYSTLNGFTVVNGWINQIDYLIPILDPVHFWVNAAMVSLPALVTYKVGLFLYNRVRG